MGLDYQADEFPVVFWDLFGAQGHPIRTTVSEMGPLLLSRQLDLNDTQEGVLNIPFRVPAKQGTYVTDLNDSPRTLTNFQHTPNLLTGQSDTRKAILYRNGWAVMYLTCF